MASVCVCSRASREPSLGAADDEDAEAASRDRRSSDADKMYGSDELALGGLIAVDALEATWEADMPPSYVDVEGYDADVAE